MESGGCFQSSISRKKIFDMLKTASTEATLQKSLEDVRHSNTSRSVENCPTSQMSCEDGSKCIGEDQFCDGTTHCKDASDETFCSCIKRISKLRLCDGYADCPNGEDEVECFGCSTGMFNCDDWTQRTQLATCIPIEQRCDGIEQCPTGKDEHDCSMLFESVSDGQNFEVPNLMGFLHHNYRGRWYPACNGADIWATEVCENEISSNTLAPSIHWITTGTHYHGLFVDGSESQPPQLVDACQNGNVFVECPPLLCGTRVKLRNPYRSEEVDVSAERVMSVFQTTPANDILGASRVVGGDPSQPDSWPWIVAIYRNGMFHCGGVIIQESWIITAAHCVDRYWLYYFEIRAGIIRRFSYSPMGQNRKVSNVVGYQLYDRAKLKNDLALMKVSEPFVYNQYVRPICLPSELSAGQNFMRGPSAGTKCTTVGWGATIEHGSDPDNLREVEVPIIEKCKHSADEEGKAICAGFVEGGKDACQGDSGGPLMCKNPNQPLQWYLAGIISHGEGCARPNEPGVYTRVSLYLEWIFTTTNAKIFPQRKPLRHCPGYLCKNTLHCISNKKRCNKVVDCLLADDEIHCEKNGFGEIFKEAMRHMLLGGSVPLRSTPRFSDRSDILRESPASSNYTTSTTQATFVTDGTSTTLERSTTIKGSSSQATTLQPAATTTLKSLNSQTISTQTPSDGTTTTTSNTNSSPTSKQTAADGTTAISKSNTIFKGSSIQPTSTNENITRSTIAIKSTSPIAIKLSDLIPGYSSTTSGPFKLLPHSTIAPDTHFHCGEILEVIDREDQCNRVADCEDATDESKCTCRDFLVRYHPEVLFDGVYDCMDVTDEQKGVCGADYFNCHRSKMCVPKNKFCNIAIDCPLAEDEEDCFALSDGHNVRTDMNNRPGILKSGLVSTMGPGGYWQIMCYNLTDHEAAHYSALICEFLGFTGYKSFVRVDFEPENPVKCIALQITCEDGLDITIDANSASNSRILDQTPWNADIYADGVYHCNGVLLDENWIVTSSNCSVTSKLSQHYLVAILGYARSYLEEFSDDAVHIHITESISVDSTNIHLLRLEKPAPFRRYIWPLHFQVKDYRVDETETCVAMGRHLRKGKLLLLVSVANCKEGFRCFRRKFPEDTKCQNGIPWNGGVTCHSKSGWYIAAVYSEPRGYCGFSDTVTYSSVQYWKTSIQRLTSQAAFVVTPPPCAGMRCSEGNCILPTQICDSVTDCIDWADERFINCTEIKRICNETNTCNCLKSQLRCPNGKCIDKSKFCDFNQDCADSSDEPVMCTCRSYLELAYPSRICDGIRNCLDKTDEDPSFCNYTTNYYQCKISNLRIPMDYVCDNIKDCPDGDDESVCYSLRSSNSSVKEVYTQTMGVWHPGCFTNNMTVLELEQMCSLLGYPTGSAKRIDVPNVNGFMPITDPFIGVGINNAGQRRLVLAMRSGKKPLVTLEPSQHCHRLYLECLH